MDVYLLYSYVLLNYISQICGYMCVSWSLYSNQLEIVCKIRPLYFSVYFYDPSGNKVAFCSPPIGIYSECLSSNIERRDHISQNISSGETVYVVTRNRNDHLLSGLWTCSHGRSHEKASVNVVFAKSSGNIVPTKVTLNGPRYVQTKRKLSLICTSNTDSVDSAVSFQLNNQFYAKIYKNSSGCFSSLEESFCQDDLCQCFLDGRTFLLQYVTQINDDVLAFKCSMVFKNFGTLSDSLYVSVVDISGPFITSDKEFPLLAGSFVEMTCKTSSSGAVTNIVMNCLDTIVKSRREIKNEYIAKVFKMVTSLDNGRKCSCKVSGDITSLSLITLQVIRAPILETVDKVFCNNTDFVILSCRISGELSEFGFSQWEHRFHDTFIRSVTGNISGNVSFLSIDSCNYKDNGEYICKAWNQDSKQLFRRKSSISVIVTGPPVVIDNFITMDTNVTLTVKFLSMERPYNLKWYYEDSLLSNHTLYFQNSSKDVFVIRMYGQIVIYNGYIANLTMINRGYGTVKYLLLLENEFGTAKVKFKIKFQDKGSAILHTIDEVFCNRTESIILSCQISGEMSEFGFSSWKHRFHGTFIRSIPGNVTGNVLFLTIDSCNYEDNGEYICEAWNKAFQQLFRQSKSTTVIITGPPIVIDNSITMNTNITLSVKYLSMERPYNLKWYHGDILLSNSTLYFQKSSKDDFVIQMYGQIVIHRGFIANLTMVKGDYGIFKCLLENNYGTAASRFELDNNDKGSDDFNMRLIGWISLTTVLFLVSIFLSTVLVYRHRKGSHINAVSRTIYFAAPGETVNANIYNVTSSHYEEIDDGYILPNSTNPGVMNDTENYEEYQQEGVPQYLELE